MKTIKVMPLGIVCEVNDNENLMTAIRRHKELFLDTPCNGSGVCGKCRIRLITGELTALSEGEKKKLNEEELKSGLRLACCTSLAEECEYAVVEIPERVKNTVVLDAVGEIKKGEKPLFCNKGEGRLGVAIDIGTTTVALSLMDIDSASIIAKASDVNPQVKIGGDVLTRIAHTMTNDNGLDELQDLIVSCLNKLTLGMLQKVGRTADDVSAIVVAANCTMLHLLLGVDPKPIGQAPYIPPFTEGKILDAKDIGLLPEGKAKLYCLPSISAYIGADITAGIYMSDLYSTDKSVLFIDIGTNGEIVLSHKNKLYSCSCAVGPALEGMNISCGMRAAEGSIERVKFEDGKLNIKAIADAKPVGICGSGVLEIMEMLLNTGSVNPDGKVTPKNSAIRERYYEEGREKGYVILRSGNPAITHESACPGEYVETVGSCASDADIVFTQKDVRQIQLAKGAILSGFTALIRHVGISFADLDEVIIAGQFGSHLNVGTMVATGILPIEVEDKVKYIGNSSLTGACSALLDETLVERLENIAGDVEYIELATLKDYNRLLMDCLKF